MRKGSVVGNLLSVICLAAHRQRKTDNGKLFIACAQTVGGLRNSCVWVGAFCTRVVARLQHRVQNNPSLSPATPGCFPVVFHGNFGDFTSVFNVFMPTIHTTYKYNDKVY